MPKSSEKNNYGMGKVNKSLAKPDKGCLQALLRIIELRRKLKSKC